jgi:ATP-binding cassette, subfamily B, bacterial
MIYKYLVGDFVSKFKWEIITYLLIVLVFFPIESILIPKVYGILFEQIKSFSKLTNFFNFKDNIKNMNFPGAITILILLWFLVICSYSAKQVIESILVPNYFSYSRQIIYDKTMNTYQNEYKDMKTGDYLARVLELTRNFKDIFQYILSRFLPELIVSILITGYMLYQNTILGVILFTCVVLCVIIHYYGGKYIVDLVTDRETYFNTVLSENIRDSLDNLMNVFLNNELGAEVKKSNKIEEIAINKLKNIMYWQNVIVFTTQIIVAIAFMIAILYLYNMVSNNVIRTSHAIVLVIILGQFLGNFIHVNAGFSHGVIYRFGVINASYDWLNNIFKHTRKREKKEGIEHGEITFEHVKFRYDTNKDEWLFKDLNLKFEAQKRYAIVGRSGSGKTTIMKMLAGLHLPEEGSLYIDDLNIKDADLEYLRENVNYINQRTNMFNESVVYNMLYGNEHVSEEELIQKLKKYDLLKVFDDLPDGVQANAGVQGGNLSGGMQRITILVRGLLKSSKIVVIDEPLSGVDQKTVANVSDMLMEESKGKTLIIITHERSLLPKMDKVYEMSDITK